MDLKLNLNFTVAHPVSIPAHTCGVRIEINLGELWTSTPYKGPFAHKSTYVLGSGSEMRSCYQREIALPHFPRPMVSGGTRSSRMKVPIKGGTCLLVLSKWWQSYQCSPMEMEDHGLQLQLRICALLWVWWSTRNEFNAQMNKPCCFRDLPTATMRQFWQWCPGKEHSQHPACFHQWIFHHLESQLHRDLLEPGRQWFG